MYVVLLWQYASLCSVICFCLSPYTYVLLFNVFCHVVLILCVIVYPIVTLCQVK